MSSSTTAGTAAFAEERSSWVPMIAIALGQVLMSFNVASLPVALSGMVHSFNVPPTTVATGIVMYSLAVAGLVMLGAKLNQRFGSLRYRHGLDVDHHEDRPPLLGERVEGPLEEPRSFTFGEQLDRIGSIARHALPELVLGCGRHAGIAPAAAAPFVVRHTHDDAEEPCLCRGAPGVEAMPAPMRDQKHFLGRVLQTLLGHAEALHHLT